MKTYIHIRLRPADRAVLDDLKRATGQSESDLIRRGLRLVQQDLGQAPSARELAGPSVGKFAGGSADLARNKRHLDGFST